MLSLQSTPFVVPVTPAMARERAAIPDDPTLFKELITLVMSRSGLTQAEIARRLGIAAQSVHQYHKGTRQNPSLKWFMHFIRACGAHVVVEFPDPLR